MSTRVAIVTGAAQGIGLAIALRLADDGLDVAINDIPSKSEAIDNAVKAVKAKGRKAIAIPGDVSSEEDVKNMIEKTASKLGSLDVVRFIYLCFHDARNSTDGGLRW
jgi:NAD(P)-dependent dehydrogenase (short-subunit alcohol dehydrogenase family)